MSNHVVYSYAIRIKLIVVVSYAVLSILLPICWRTFVDILPNYRLTAFGWRSRVVQPRETEHNKTLCQSNTLLAPP